MPQRSSRAGNYGFIGGMAGAALGWFIPTLRGTVELAGLMQMVWATLGFVVGMLAGLLVAMILER